MSHFGAGLIVYTRLPAVFGLNAVSEVLQKNERTVRRWVDDFASNRGEFSESQQAIHKNHVNVK